MSNSIFKYHRDFILESGSVLPGFDLAYQTYGRLSHSGDNVVWVFHAFTGNANPSEWWDGLVGEGKFFNPGKYFIICVNMPGSCYGSSGPLSLNPNTAQPWYHDFPIITTRDMARMFALLQQNLGIRKIHVGIGGSMGGMVLLEWSIEQPELFENIILIATNAVQSAWGIAFNETQRMAIESDGTWRLKNEKAGLQGMATARAIALLSYRNYHPYKISQGETDNQKLNCYRGSSYQQYQGLKLTRRFNAFSYHALTKSMDAHHVGRGRSSVAGALRGITAKTLVVGIASDLLFSVEEQKFLAGNIPDAQFACIDSTYGHDGFLIEYQQLEKIIRAFLFSPRRRKDANIAQPFEYDLAS